MNELSKCNETLNRTQESEAKVEATELLKDVDNSVSQSAIPGSIVTFNLLDHEENETDTYTLKLVDHFKKNEDELSVDSPIGKSIHRAFVGESKTYTINSRQFTVTIIDIKTAV